VTAYVVERVQAVVPMFGSSSLASVAAWLRDAGAMLGDERSQAHAQDLILRITGPEHTLAGAAFVRFPGDTGVEGSLLWLAVPFGLMDVRHPTYVNTVTRTEHELGVPAGGPTPHLAACPLVRGVSRPAS
jgi:hypothetical protein